MPRFQPGQQVKLIDDAMEGVVVKEMEDNQVLIRTEDDFELPVDADDLVEVEPWSGEPGETASDQPAAPGPEAGGFETLRPETLAEKIGTDKPPSAADKPGKRSAPKAPDAPKASPDTPNVEPLQPNRASERMEVSHKGLLLAFVKQIRPEIVRLYVINDLNKEALYTLHEKRGDGWKPLGRGWLSAGAYQAYGDYNLNELESWRPLRVGYMAFGEQRESDPKPCVFEQSFRASNFLKREGFAPHVEAPAYVIELQHQLSPGLVRLTPALGEQEKAAAGPGFQEIPGRLVIDLHDYALDQDVRDWDHGDIFHYQLEYFERQLDEGLRRGYQRLVVIHGVGSGRLKREISRILRQHPRVKQTGPAAQLEFGNGATEAILN
jgi:hypothetical protein